MKRSPLETTIRNMVACDILAKPLSSLGQKAKRRRDKLAHRAQGYIGQASKLTRAFARIEETEQEKARTLTEGIKVFKDQHPRSGKILESLIAETRAERCNELTYGININATLGVADYRSVMTDLGLTAREADAMYGHIIDIGDRLGKPDQYEERSILLSS